MRQDNEAAKGHRKALYTMLWNAGTRHFRAKAYGACVQLYAAALMYADVAAKPIVARQLALAHMGVQDTDRRASRTTISCLRPHQTSLCGPCTVHACHNHALA